MCPKANMTLSHTYGVVTPGVFLQVLARLCPNVQQMLYAWDFAQLPP